MTEEDQRHIQELLLKSRALMDELQAFAVKNKLERIEFMGGYIHFGTTFDQDWSKELGYHGGAFEVAVGGPVFNDKHWEASTYCWPPDGPDSSKWRKTSYDDED